jgi:hypothetical protein
MLYRITCNKFCAGVIVDGEIIIETAPILKRYRGKDFIVLQRDIKSNGWKIEPIYNGGFYEKIE